MPIRYQYLHNMKCTCNSNAVKMADLMFEMMVLGLMVLDLVVLGLVGVLHELNKMKASTIHHEALGAF